MTAQEKKQPLFPLGQVLATPGALESIEMAGQTPLEFIARHHVGDWGDLDDEDKQENELSLEQGYRLLSAYQTRLHVKIWVITEADRSATTVLLPSEY